MALLRSNPHSVKKCYVPNGGYLNIFLIHIDLTSPFLMTFLFFSCRCLSLYIMEQSRRSFSNNYRNIQHVLVVKTDVCNTHMFKETSIHFPEIIHHTLTCLKHSTLALLGFQFWYSLWSDNFGSDSKKHKLLEKNITRNIY